TTAHATRVGGTGPELKRPTTSSTADRRDGRRMRQDLRPWHPTAPATTVASGGDAAVPSGLPVERIVVPVEPTAARGPDLDVAEDLARRWGVGLLVERRAVAGPVAADVVDAAGPHGLVVMPATDGDRAPALLGSTVADVVETASGPVVLVGPRVVAG